MKICSNTNSTLECHHQLFQITGDTLPEKDVISSHAVLSNVECSFYCLQTSTCVGFNDGHKSNKCALNCQLSIKTRTRGQQGNAEEKWMFYEGLRKVRK